MAGGRRANPSKKNGDYASGFSVDGIGRLTFTEKREVDLRFSRKEKPMTIAHKAKAPKLLAVVAAFAVLAASTAHAQRGVDGQGKATGIAWFGSWDAGLAAAKASGRPILLIAAAPHCHGVSGIW